MKILRNTLWVGGLFSLTAVALSAQGGPPFLTDDPGTPEVGHWEINTAWVHESHGPEKVDELPLLDVNYGWSDHLQLKYEVSHLLVTESGAERETGLSNSLVGAKWRFYEQEGGAAISVYPQLEFRNPGSSSARRGLVANETTLILPVQFARELRPGCELGAEVGYVRPGQSESSWLYGVVLGGEVRKGLEIGIELHGTCNRGAGRSELAVNLGARKQISSHGALLLSVGREIHNHFETRASVISYVGWQWLP